MKAVFAVVGGFIAFFLAAIGLASVVLLGSWHILTGFGMGPVDAFLWAYSILIAVCFGVFGLAMLGSR